MMAWFRSASRKCAAIDRPYGPAPTMMLSKFVIASVLLGSGDPPATEWRLAPLKQRMSKQTMAAAQNQTTEERERRQRIVEPPITVVNALTQFAAARQVEERFAPCRGINRRLCRKRQIELMAVRSQRKIDAVESGD